MNNKIRKERLIRIDQIELEEDYLGIVLIKKLYKRVIFNSATNRTFDLDEMKYSGNLTPNRLRVKFTFRIFN